MTLFIHLLTRLPICLPAYLPTYLPTYLHVRLGGKGHRAAFTFYGSNGVYLRRHTMLQYCDSITSMMPVVRGACL